MTPDEFMENAVTLEKSCYVYLKEGGEICNLLGRGTRVWPIKRNGEWVKVTWRKGKKKGWIHQRDAGQNPAG